LHIVIFEIRMPLHIKFTVFWNVTPCSLVKRYHITEEPAAFFLQESRVKFCFFRKKKLFNTPSLGGKSCLYFDLDL